MVIAEEGYHPQGTPTWVDPALTATSQPLMVITEQQAAVLLQRQYRCTHESRPAVATPTRRPSLSPWQITREVQMNDPYLRRVISSLEAKPVELESWAIPRRAIARVHRQNYLMRDGVVHFLDGEGEHKLVPSPGFINSSTYQPSDWRASWGQSPLPTTG